jgi:hypothetical protein
MSSPNQQIQKHIDSNSELLAKMNKLTQQLQTDLLSGFQNGMGVPLPTAVEADVRELTYSMVYSSDPIVDHYMNGAKQLLDAAFTGDMLAVANKALNVVGVLLNNVIGQAAIQTGANHQSMKIHEAGKTFVSAAWVLVEECQATSWATQSNFYLSYYAFVTWQPSEHALNAITRARPALAWAAV